MAFGPMTIVVTNPADMTATAPGTYNLTATVDTPSTTLYGSATSIANEIAKIIKENMR
jgi:hypothetical protein